MNEHLLFSYADVKVSSQHFSIQEKRYAISDISAVELRLIEPKRIVAFILLLTGIFLLLDEGRLFAVGGFSVLLGIVFWVSGGTRYAVVIKSAAAEQQVLISPDRLFIEKVVHALDAAMLNRIHPGVMSQPSRPDIPYRDSNDISFGAS